MNKKKLIVGLIALIVVAANLPMNAVTLRCVLPNRHGRIIDSVLPGLGFSADATAFVKEENKDADSRGANVLEYHASRYYWKNETTGKWESETHRQAFDRLRDFILEQRALFNQCALDCMLFSALLVLGPLTHALADFFSHTNYLDLDSTDQEQALKALEDPNEEPPGSLNFTGWTKGSFFGGSFWSWLWGTNHKDPLEYHHNKYSGDNDQAAEDAARAYTEAFLDKLKAEILAIDPNAWNKFGDWTRLTEYSDWSKSYIRTYNMYTFSLDFTSYCAVNLTITEALPFGVVFIDSEPAPLSVEIIPTTPTLPNETITLVKWRFLSAEPIGQVSIRYRISVYEPAITYPVVPMRGMPGQPETFGVVDRFEEIDESGICYKSFFEQYTPSPQPGHNGGDGGGGGDDIWKQAVKW
jgi:hypothetical protein